jgi:hypothetical protein
MLRRYLFGEPTPTMSMLTYTTRAVLPGTRSPLSSSCGPSHLARAVLPETRYPLSSSGGPSSPARAVLPGTGMPMSSSSGSPRPASALSHRDVRLPEAWALYLYYFMLYPLYTMVSVNI